VTDKIRVDFAELNGHDYIAIEETTGKPISEIMGSARGIYAAAWRARLRNGDLSATFDNTLDFPMTAFDVEGGDTNGQAGKPLGSDGGEKPLSLPESGL
jgi:hypothetical protein